YVANVDGSEVVRLTTNGTIKGDPVWSPDGSSITYWERQINGVLQLVAIDVANPTRTRPLSFSNSNNGMAFWSPDGSRLFYESDRTSDTLQIYAAIPDGNAPIPLTDVNFNSGRATIAPDGSLLMFTTDRYASDELYLMNVDGDGVE